MDEVSNRVRESKSPRQQRGLKKWIARQNKFKDAEGIARTINTAFDLLAICEHTNYAYEAFILGGQAIGGYGCEWQFPLDKYLHALEVIYETLGQAREEGEQVLTGPIALRFVRASRAYLSPQYAPGNMRERAKLRNGSCMIEITSLYGTPGFDRRSGRADDYVLMHRLYQRLIKLGGRPHWGLEFNDLKNTGGKLGKLYPKWKTWLEVYQRFNTGTFNNAFTDRIGISVKR